MDIKKSIRKFILNNATINSTNVDTFLNKLKSKNITTSKLLKAIFDVLNDYIFELSKHDYQYIIDDIDKCINLLTIFFQNNNFNKEEIVVNRNRIKKSSGSLLAYASKYDNDTLKKLSEDLDSIVLDKDLYIYEFDEFIKQLIDKIENPNIIKKYFNIYKNIIPINKTNIFDYVFNKYINSINDNKENLLYYLTLMRITYDSKIDKNKYENILLEYKDDFFTNELLGLFNGNKFSLSAEQVLEKYHIVKEIEPSQIQIDKKTDTTTQEFVFTIDNENTKLRDDGLSIRKDGNKYIIGIHIADPGKYISPNSQIDTIAKNNFKSSQYTTILPPNYEKFFSLDEGGPKSVITLYVVMNDAGEILDYYIKENEIIVSNNLSYISSDYILNNSTKSKLKKSLEELYMLSKALEYKNKNKLEYWRKKEFSKSENYKNISFKSDMIVREFMVLYNSLLSDFTVDKNIPYIYKWQNKEYISDLLSRYNLKDYQIIKDITKELYLDSKYSTFPRYHNGIGISSYSNSGNPLRKYPDLYTQYLLHKFNFKDKDFYFDEEEFQRLVNYFNQRNFELSLMKAEYKRALKYYNN